MKSDDRICGLVWATLIWSLWIISGGLSAVAEPAQKPSSRTATLENLEAFARLYGYVRFFHPSDEAASTDWDAFAVHGVDRVLALEKDSSGEFADLLRELFIPIAPTLQIYPAGTAPSATRPQPADTSGLEVVAWQHQGVGLGSGPSIYESVRTARERPATKSFGFGTILQGLDATQYRGQTIRLRASARTQLEGAGDQAQIWLRVDRPSRQMGFFDNMDDRPIRVTEWTAYELVGEVAVDAEGIVFGSMLRGAGAAWFDDFTLEFKADSGDWQPIELKNPDFESSEDLTGWTANSPGYVFDVTSENSLGEHSVRITGESATTTQRLFDALPEIGASTRKEIGAGLAIDLPLALWSDETSTLEQAPENAREALARSLSEFSAAHRGADDLSTQIAAVMVAWNVMQHFYPYFDVVEVDWTQELRARLAATFEAKEPWDHYRNMKRLAAALQDGHGSVYHQETEKDRAGLAIALEWIEEQIVVVASDVEGVQPGDVLMSIDGESALERLQQEMALNSGTVQWRRHRALRWLPVGERGSVAQLVVHRGTSTGTADEPHTVQAERQDREGPKGADRQPIELLENEAFYVDLSRATMTEIQEHLEALAAAPGVIFDLRGYPNSNHELIAHLTDKPVQSARWNVPRFIYPDQDGEIGWATEGRWTLEPKEPRIRNAVFLTDGRAISYAESFLGIIEAYDLAPIVGQATAGANGNVNPLMLPGGYRMVWTGMKVLKHDGSPHHLVGILPTVPFERTVAGVRAGRDEVLERALIELKVD